MIIKIKEDMKKYMKSGLVLERDTVRLLLAEIKNKEIETKSIATEDDVYGAINKLIKQISESFMYANKANDEEKMNHYACQLKVLKGYLPEQLSIDEINDMANKVISENGFSGKKDMGKAIKLIMPMIKGRADNKIVSTIISQLLA